MSKHIYLGNKQSVIAKKVKLYKELYGVERVTVRYTGYVKIDGKVEFLTKRLLSEDFKRIDYYGFYKIFSVVFNVTAEPFVLIDEY